MAMVRWAGKAEAGLLVLATVVSCFPSTWAMGGSGTPLRVALEAGGTLTWELHVVHRLGLDRVYGLDLEATRYATKAAAETALRGGEADVKVDDWLFVTRARDQGVPVQAVDAFSRAVGGVVVKRGTPLWSVADLRGRRIGVTSLADKSYVILRAVAVTQFGFDPQRESQVLTAAPPLLDRLLERGDVDAIVQYWQFIPRLISTGQFRELTSVHALLRRLVPRANLPFLVVVATDDAVRTRPGQVTAFLRAVRDAKSRLASTPALWSELSGAGLLGAPDPAVIPALMARYRAGLPGPWTDATIMGLQHLTATLVSVVGPDVLGVSHLDPRAYTTALSPR